MSHARVHGHAVHAWAYPENGGSPIFLFATTYGNARERDVTRLLFGDQFAMAGFIEFSSPSTPLPSGSYRVVAYALSAVTGTFDAVRVVRIVIP